MHRLRELHRRLACCIVLAVVSAGCGATGGTETDTASDGSSGTTASEACVAASAPTWDSFGEAFFATYCARCHSETLTGAARNGAPFDYNFDTVELVRMQSRKIELVAAGDADGINNSMPLGDPKPSDAERVTLGEWLACGAP